MCLGFQFCCHFLLYHFSEHLEVLLNIIYRDFSVCLSPVQRSDISDWKDEAYTKWKKQSSLLSIFFTTLNTWSCSSVIFPPKKSNRRVFSNRFPFPRLPFDLHWALESVHMSEVCSILSVQGEKKKKVQSHGAELKILKQKTSGPEGGWTSFTAAGRRALWDSPVQCPSTPSHSVPFQTKS